MDVTQTHSAAPKIPLAKSGFPKKLAPQTPGDNSSPAEAGESLWGRLRKAQGESVLATLYECWASPAPVSGDIDRLPQKLRHTQPDQCIETSVQELQEIQNLLAISTY